jgi:hypothetical protein
MKKIFFIVISTLTMISCRSTYVKNKSFSISEGVYYGKSGGYLSPRHIFAKISNDTIFVEGFFTLKFIRKVFSDTMVIKLEDSNLIAKGNFSVMLKQKENLIIKTIDKYKFKYFVDFFNKIKIDTQALSQWHRYKNEDYFFKETENLYDITDDEKHQIFLRLEAKHKMGEKIFTLTHKKFLLEFEKFIYDWSLLK